MYSTAQDTTQDTELVKMGQQANGRDKWEN